MKDRRRLILVAIACVATVILIIVSGVLAQRRAGLADTGTVPSSEQRRDPIQRKPVDKQSKKRRTGTQGQHPYPGTVPADAQDVCSSLASKALTAYLDRDADLTDWFAADADGLQWRDRIIEQPDARPTAYLVHEGDGEVVCSVYQGLPYPWTLTYGKDPTYGWVVRGLDLPAQGAFSPTKGTGPQTAGGDA